MKELITSIKKTIKLNKMVKKNDKIVLGVSGGADSMCLFYVLLELGYNFCVVHINHGIRENSINDENFVKQVCEDNNITCYVFNFDIKKERISLKMTEEEAGRHLRYESFMKVLDLTKSDKIAVAHNLNDQAETMLLRFFRGTGVYGLAGIKAVRDNIIIRPLLYTTRSEIETYLNLINKQFINDETNQKQIYGRNKIRLNLIPYIENNFNKNIIKTLTRSNEIISIENDYLEKVSNEAFNICCEHNEINISKLLSFDKAIVRRVLRIACNKIGEIKIDINYENIIALENLLYNQTGKSIMLNNNMIVKKNYNFLSFNQHKFVTNEQLDCLLLLDKLIYVKQCQFYISISSNSAKNIENLNIVYTNYLQCDRISFDICLRYKKTGDKIKLKNLGYKKLKDFFIDEKIPSDIRANIPLLVLKDKDGYEEVLWIIGYRKSERLLDNKDFLLLKEHIETSKNEQENETNNKLETLVIQIWEDIKR